MCFHLFGSVSSRGRCFFCAEMLKFNFFLENTCVTKKLAYICDMTNTKQHTMDFSHITINTPQCGVYNGYANKVRQLMVEANSQLEDNYLLKTGRAYTEAKTENRKIKLSTYFKVGTMVFSKSRYGNEGRFNCVVSLTKAGYPKLDNGDVLKYMHGTMGKGFTLSARTTSKDWGLDCQSYTFFM